MNEFDRRWQRCASRARAVPERRVEAPSGFATRVLAEVARPARNPAPLALWERLVSRALAAVTVMLIVLGVLEYRDSRSSWLTGPNIENTVAQAFWIL